MVISVCGAIIWFEPFAVAIGEILGTWWCVLHAVCARVQLCLYVSTVICTPCTYANGFAALVDGVAEKSDENLESTPLAGQCQPDDQ